MAKDIVIRDSGEKLVDLKRACPKLRIALDRKRMKREGTAYLRFTVAKMLNKAISYLPKGMTFIIRDAWRPQYIQQEIMEEFVMMFKRKNPGWSQKRARAEAEKYVANSKGPKASGHMTGGAVDLRLLYKGKRVPMRSKRLSYQQNADPLNVLLPEYLKRNRLLMFAALQKAGFSQCHNEFWHWSYGDVQWAERTGRNSAIYGVVENKS